MKVTVLYYTANKEDEVFERAIVEKLKERAVGLPIVSVSQKPMFLGKNVCVGLRYPCYFNEFRQIQIGLREIETPYVLVAESDFLYPREYFGFVPDGRDCYRYRNVWVLNEWENVFRFKGISDGAQMVRREYWLDRLDKGFDGNQEWHGKQDTTVFPRMQPATTEAAFWAGPPAVTFKTSRSVRLKTQLSKKLAPVGDLAPWGSVAKIREEMNV